VLLTNNKISKILYISYKYIKYISNPHIEYFLSSASPYKNIYKRYLFSFNLINTHINNIWLRSHGVHLTKLSHYWRDKSYRWSRGVHLTELSRYWRDKSYRWSRGVHLTNLSHYRHNMRYYRIIRWSPDFFRHFRHYKFICKQHLSLETKFFVNFMNVWHR